VLYRTFQWKRERTRSTRHRSYNRRQELSNHNSSMVSLVHVLLSRNIDKIFILLKALW